MHKPINGWTKAKILKHIEDTFTFKAVGLNLGDGCMYKTEDGTKCAVGIFIPDELYSESMEGEVYYLLEQHEELLPHMPLRVEGLSDLQGIHDRSNNGTTKGALLNWVKTNVSEDTA